jgi:putative phosphoribosyl transferase
MFKREFLFRDRNEAGVKLAANLLDEPLIKAAAREDLLVLSIPRGGVIVGAAVAQALGCSHDIIAVNKIGFPGQKETIIGAMAEDGLMVLNRQILNWSNPYIKQAIELAKTRLETTLQKFRHGRELDLCAKMVIVVDDGIATGETMKAAMMWLALKAKLERPTQVLAAVPCAAQAAGDFEKLADKFICLNTLDQLLAVGQVYQNFNPIGDREVMDYLSPSLTVLPLWQFKLNVSVNDLAYVGCN